MAGRRFLSWLHRDAAEPAEQAVADGLPAEVALVIESMSFFDRGVADVESGEHRIVAMSANGRAGFACSREGAEGWLRKCWPKLSDAQVSAGVGLIHARMTAFMRNVDTHNAVPGHSSRWADWRPLPR